MEVHIRDVTRYPEHEGRLPRHHTGHWGSCWRLYAPIPPALLMLDDSGIDAMLSDFEVPIVTYTPRGYAGPDARVVYWRWEPISEDLF